MNQEVDVNKAKDNEDESHATRIYDDDMRRKGLFTFKKARNPLVDYSLIAIGTVSARPPSPTVTRRAPSATRIWSTNTFHRTPLRRS